MESISFRIERVDHLRRAAERGILKLLASSTTCPGQLRSF